MIQLALANDQSWPFKRCAVIGSGGGIGAAFTRQLNQIPEVDRLFCFSRSAMKETISKKIKVGRIDYSDAHTIRQAAKTVEQDGMLDLVIVATGLLHDEHGFGPEKSLRELDREKLARSYLINTIGPALVAQSFLPLLAKNKMTVFATLSARVGSISDNRIGGWYGYRAAKAGLNQIIRTASIEHARRWKNSAVVGLHPGTVDTNLSKPFQRNVADGKLFDADISAVAMLDVLKKITPRQTGKVLAYDGSEVPA